MKNITVSIDDETYHRARIQAAERSSSVSAMVRKFLIQLTAMPEGETDFERLRREQNQLIANIRVKHNEFSATENVSREQIYD